MKRMRWDEYYQLAQEIKEEKGTINVPCSFIYKNVNMGQWFRNQRARRRELSEERIEKLNNLGFEWNGINTYKAGIDNHFVEMVELLKKYKKEYGDMRVPADYTVYGIKLGRWAQNIRRIFRGTSNRSLSDEKKKFLIDLGFEFEWYSEANNDKWFSFYEILKEVLKDYRLSEVVEDFAFNGIRIGHWVHQQRVAYKSGKLIAERKILLDEIGFDFNPNDKRWDNAFSKAEQFYKEFHHLEIPDGYCVDGFNLGAWISNQRQVFNGSRKDMILTDEQVGKLESIGMSWKVSSASNTSFAEQVIVYYLSKLFPDLLSRDKSLGIELDIFIPSAHIAVEYDGYHWHKTKIKEDDNKDTICSKKNIRLIRIRELPLKGTIEAACYFRATGNTFKSLESVLAELIGKEFGMEVDINIERDSRLILKDFYKFSNKTWYSMYKEAKEYYQENGNLLVPNSYVSANGVALGRWISSQRNAYKGNVQINTLSDNEIRLLEEIGMVWDVLEMRWENNYKVASEYYEEHGNLLVPKRLVYHGVKLGKWINVQRNDHNLPYRKNARMNEERIRKLEKIGMVWTTKEKVVQ